MRKNKFNFFDEHGDNRMEQQNFERWEALATYIKSVASDLPKAKWDVLDVGSHTGGLLGLIRKRFEGQIASLAGVEPIEAASKTAKEALPQATFFTSIGDVPDQSADLIVSHEVIYLIENLDEWMRHLKRILRPDGGAFIVLGSHGENTAWRRWQDRLNELHEHASYVHYPMHILQTGAKAGFDTEIGSLPVPTTVTWRFTPPEDGWGEFDSVEEMLNFHHRWKYLFVFYPKR